MYRFGFQVLQRVSGVSSVRRPVPATGLNPPSRLKRWVSSCDPPALPPYRLASCCGAVANNIVCDREGAVIYCCTTYRRTYVRAYQSADQQERDSRTALGSRCWWSRRSASDRALRGEEL